MVLAAVLVLVALLGEHDGLHLGPLGNYRSAFASRMQTTFLELFGY